MIIFVKGIPSSAQRQDLHDFILRGLQRRWLLPMFQKKSVDKCDILRIENMENQRFEYHGLVHVGDDRTGQALIKQLDGTRFGDREVEVRSYQQRTGQRDRRLLPQSGPGNLAIVDRRCKERRRQNLIVETI